MIDQGKCLSPALIKLLTLPDLTIGETARTFLSHVESAREDGTGFLRALQISNTLEQLEKSLRTHDAKGRSSPNDQMASLRFEIEHDDGAASVQLNEEELLAFFLNGEYILVIMYEEYGLRRNPFLIHWIESYQQLLNLYLGDEDDDHEHFGGSGLFMKLINVRTAFIEAILNAVNQIGKSTPREYASDFSHYPVDINSFNESLVEQMVYDTLEQIPWYQAHLMNGELTHRTLAVGENRPSETWTAIVHVPELNKGSVLGGATTSLQSHPTPPPGLPERPLYVDHAAAQHVVEPQDMSTGGCGRGGGNGATAAYIPSPSCQRHGDNETSLLEKLYDYMQKAQVDEISYSDAEVLLKHFEEYPTHLFAVFRPTEEALTNLATANPRLAKLLVQLYLLTASPGSEERDEMLQNLPRLSVSLQALELINQLVVSSVNAFMVAAPRLSDPNSMQAPLSKQEINLLLHTYLANAMLKAEALGGIAETSHQRQDSLSDIYAGVGHFAGGTSSQQARNMQHRMVQLLCLFVQALIKNGIIRLEEYFPEVQELGVRYIFVKEARELWQKVNLGTLGR